MGRGAIGGQSWVEKLFKDVQAHVLALACDEVVIVSTPAVPTGYVTAATLIDGSPSQSQYNILKPPGLYLAPGDYAATIKLAKIRFIVAKVQKTADVTKRFDLPLAAPTQYLYAPDTLSLDAADNPSTTNTATYVQALADTITLPDVGNWNIRCVGLLRMSNSISTAVNLRFSAGAFVSTGRVITATTALQLMKTTTILGPFTGGAGVAVALQYKSSGASTTSVDQPSIILDAWRVS